MINANDVKFFLTKVVMWSVLCSFCCSSTEDDVPHVGEPGDETMFYFGADLSYVNQIVDRGGVYKTSGISGDPYKIFSDKGTNLVRLRLWHNPHWTKEVYGDAGTQLYNDIEDVERAIRKAKEYGMKVLLDFHYSDIWADPGTQKIPAAWKNITSIDILEDSVYEYTFRTMTRLKDQDLAPDFVQIGNETNCGMMITDIPAGFPELSVCDGNWASAGRIFNAGIKAVRDLTVSSEVKTSVILHVADPKNVEWWFDNMTGAGGVSGFDIVGFSYYPLWHTTVPVADLSNRITFFKSRYGKDVMILETAYPWTSEANDGYNNQFGSEAAISGYPKSPQGQHEMMVRLTKAVKDGGGIGLIYWEPAWISSPAKDLWGTGSSWENCAFFNFDGNANQGFDFMTFDYK